MASVSATRLHACSRIRGRDLILIPVGKQEAVPSVQELRGSALPGQVGDGLLVEGHECFAT